MLQIGIRKAEGDAAGNGKFDIV